MCVCVRSRGDPAGPGMVGARTRREADGRTKGNQPPVEGGSFSRQQDGLGDSDVFLLDYEASAKNAVMLF